MIQAPVARDEFERLSTLLEYKVLDTQPEIEYDSITQLAAYICNTPTALVTLIDGNRQWFKSKFGSDLNETPRTLSICGHAIHQKEVFIVKDSLKDERFFDNPIISQLGVAFYAGAPLLSPNGHALGTICVLDSKPRDLTPEQINALKLLSHQVVSLLELRKAYHLLNQNYETLRALSKKVRDQEQLLINSTKMAALGEMAAGVAHEINNPLTIIAGRSELILSELKKENVDDDKIAKYSSAMTDAIQRTSKIIRGLKNFSGSEDESLKNNIHLNSFLDSFLALVEERARLNGITLSIDMRNECHVVGSDIQISQILINLFNNSFDALQSLRDKWIRIVIEKKNKFAEIKFIDSGLGISADVQAKMMQPFFTTKSLNKNPGLGLSISQGLATTQGGALEYDTTAKQTSFVLKIPLAK